MEAISQRKRLWGWYFFDWASQPYNTLLLTFIFAPYVKELLQDGAAAQATWGYTIGFTGLAIALLAPLLGAMADKSGHRIAWIWVFSALYVIGAGGIWLAHPAQFSLTLVLLLFALGLLGMEFATIFTNSILPDLGNRDEIGRISGSGWAFGYVGGLLALVIMLLFFAENAEGVTLLGTPPAFGLDASAREGTRLVGPFTAIWYAVFMIPFFLWVRDTGNRPQVPIVQAARAAWPELLSTLRQLPSAPSLFSFLAASMFYRDALNGLYVFGGLYAAGVLGWSVVETGIFGIIAVVTAAIFAWIGGRADSRFGPKPVIACCVAILTVLCVIVVFISRESVFGIPVERQSRLPDIAFFVLGAGIGAAGGALQSASRTMVCRQGRHDRMTQVFGLYALAGKATSYLAPLSIGIATDLTGSQQMGITPLIALFLLGLLLLRWVKPDGERAACPPSEPPLPPS
ncbi:MFS transporter [Tropicimonas marinistellae]|uniref:MFS transporter n=1 Tax=Tropicimonas marinistellae TaxID=1739787 RepID=UPI00083196CB|nr:MFS transporter [Tropicimonas marinistellae]